MCTLQDLFHNMTKPYGAFTRVKVICQGTGSNGNRYGIADHTMAVELILYDDAKASKLICGGFVSLINSSVKTSPHNQVVVGKNTRVSKTGSFDVPDAKETAARDIINPPAATFLPVPEVKTSPMKKLVSVKGQVIAVSIVYKCTSMVLHSC